MRYDLHAHSNFSDGALPPAELVARAKACEVDVLALTDHDSVDGIDAARVAAREHGLRLIAGTELSVTWNKRLLHILGLNIDCSNPQLQAGLAQLRAIRTDRAERMAKSLEKHGIPNALDGARKYAHNGIVTRRHFALYLVELGRAPTEATVFEKYLREGKPGYATTQWVALADAVSWIRAAGGVAVIAHPQRYKMTATTLRRVAKEFVDCGGAGVEVVCGGSGRDIIDSSAALARRFDLLASIGSDFHDPAYKWVELGRLEPLPANVTPIWAHPSFSAEGMQ